MYTFITIVLLSLLRHFHFASITVSDDQDQIALDMTTLSTIIIIENSNYEIVNRQKRAFVCATVSCNFTLAFLVE